MKQQHQPKVILPLPLDRVLRDEIVTAVRNIGLSINESRTPNPEDWDMIDQFIADCLFHPTPTQ